jgi:O-antigen ligase
MALGAAAGMGICTVVLTQSRGALLGLTVGLGILGVAWLWHQAPAVRPLLPVAACSVAGVIIIVAAIGQPWARSGRDVTSATWAEQEREAHWSAALAMIQADPIQGSGAGGFSRHFRDATTNWHFRIPRGHAHNAYLQVASEAGVLALVAYAAFLGAIVASLWRRIGIDSCDWLGWGVLAVTAALMAHQVFDYLHVLSLGLLFGGLWAAALPVVQRRAHELEHGSSA